MGMEGNDVGVVGADGRNQDGENRAAAGLILIREPRRASQKLLL